MRRFKLILYTTSVARGPSPPSTCLKVVTAMLSHKQTTYSFVVCAVALLMEDYCDARDLLRPTILGSFGCHAAFIHRAPSLVEGTKACIGVALGPR